MKAMIFTLSLLLMPVAAIAQNESTPKEPGVKHALGGSLGWIVGSGISYRHYFDNSFIQTGFIAAAENLNDDIATNDDVYVDFAIAYGRYLHIDRNNKWVPVGLKWLAGIESVYDESADCRFEPGSMNCVESTTVQRTVHVGGGIGVDIGRVQAQGLIVSLDLSFLATFEAGKFEGVHAPWPAISVLYNW